MLLNTYEPWKFAFSQEETDFNNLKEGAWGIIGVPFDSTTSYHPGSRFATSEKKVSLETLFL